MKHIRYISDNKTVCDKPTRLGHDFVVIDTSENPYEGTCLVCIELLFAHNAKEFDRESRTEIVFNSPPPLEDPLGPSRRLYWGFVASSVFWNIVAIIWAVFFRG